ncbi:hypothetical protein [Enterobacter ludwigii]|uniref:hypothetical protein n=1 Tax=Enterobacter ludwigii TaxID=299767 RepID=UPI002E2A3621|nr:hypothetical protein [Enterobacter ludwigii]MED5734148.1 hypothetical protein [Enterobacter ludwigii]
MSKPKPKNTVRISFTVIDENGEETLNRDYFLPFVQIKHARYPVLPDVAQTEAQKFHEAAVMMGCFGE